MMAVLPRTLTIDQSTPTTATSAYVRTSPKLRALTNDGTTPKHRPSANVLATPKAPSPTKGDTYTHMISVGHRARDTHSTPTDQSCCAHP
jgi:hypothetical protein